MNSVLRTINSFDRCDIYVVLWCVVQLEGLLHIEGVISQGLQALLLGWAIYEGGLYVIPDKRHPFILKATSILLLMYFIYGGLFIIFSPPYFPDVHYAYFKSFLSSFIPLYLFYKYSKKGFLTEDKIKSYFLLLVVVTIGEYFQLASKLIENNNAQENTNNIGYRFLVLLPLCFFLYKRRLLQYIALGIIMLFILLSVKRGAIIIGTICFIWFLSDSVKKSTNIKHKYFTIFLGSILIISAISAVSYQLANSDYLQRRIAETESGNSSGRDKLYTGIIDAIINDDSYIHLIFGRGAYSTFDIVHKMAHNDWLETACNNGLIGLSCIALFLFAFYRTANYSKKHVRPELSSVMIMMFFVFSTRMFFSMSLQGMSIAITMTIAYFASLIHENVKYIEQ